MFYPTAEEFANFSNCIERYVKAVGDKGIFRVVPPKSWVARQSGYKMRFNVSRPIE